jgi:hypothetical protein
MFYVIYYIQMCSTHYPRFIASLAAASLALASSDKAAAPDDGARCTTSPPPLSPPPSPMAPPTPAESPSSVLGTALLHPLCACAVLGAFKEREGAILGAVWNMVLLYLKVSALMSEGALCKGALCKHCLCARVYACSCACGARRALHLIINN